MGKDCRSGSKRTINLNIQNHTTTTLTKHRRLLTRYVLETRELKLWLHLKAAHIKEECQGKIRKHLLKPWYRQVRGVHFRRTCKLVEIIQPRKKLQLSFRFLQTRKTNTIRIYSKSGLTWVGKIPRGSNKVQKFRQPTKNLAIVTVKNLYNSSQIAISIGIKSSWLI